MRYFVIAFLLHFGGPTAAASPGVSMKLINSAGFPIDLFWLGDRNVPVSVPQKQNDKPIRSKAGIDINSYENHMFRIKYSNGIFETTTDFVKRAADETVIVEYDNSTGLVVKQITELEKRVDKLKSAMTLCGPSHKDGFSECVTNQLFQDIESIEDRHLTLKKTRSDMANRLRNYTCADPLMRTSTPMATNSMILNGTKITVETFLNEKNAKIFAVPNFVSDEECDILMKHGRPRLQRATVAAQDGTSVVSQSRKAQQASYDFHIARGAVDPLWPLYSKILSFTNMKNGYHLQAEGQEGFTIIQYNPGDEYINHCDADCNGEKVTTGGRIATAVLYCEVPKIGGATSFSNADVFVNPVKGTATFFSYMNANTNQMDFGLTEHSGCPVIEGEKWIAVTWMRYGVDNKRPHSILDPSGNEILQ